MAEKLVVFGAVDTRGENYSGPVPAQEVIPPVVEDTEMAEVPPAVVEEVPVLLAPAPHFECASL